MCQRCSSHRRLPEVSSRSRHSSCTHSAARSAMCRKDYVLANRTREAEVLAHVLRVRLADGLACHEGGRVALLLVALREEVELELHRVSPCGDLARSDIRGEQLWALLHHVGCNDAPPRMTEQNQW